MSATVPGTGISVPEMLRRAWPVNTAKQAARVARISVRTAEDWLYKRSRPSAEMLLRMAAENEALRAEVLRALAGTRHAMDQEQDQVAARASAVAAGRVVPPAGGAALARAQAALAKAEACAQRAEALRDRRLCDGD